MSEGPIAEPMSDNHALRRIVGDLDLIVQILSAAYEDSYGAEVAITDEETAVRAADADAIKAVVTNLADTPVYIYENGLLVATLYLEETWESALGGLQAISAKCKVAAATSAVAVTTYKLPLDV